MPHWGRPSGAPAGGEGGAWRDEFESRRRRFLELDSESEEAYQRVYLDPAGLKSRSTSSVDRGEHTGDELAFTGYDLGSARDARRIEGMPYGGPYRPAEDDYYYENPVPRPSREDALVQSAKEKLRKARVKGKRNVSLSVEEMAALEGSMQGPPEPRTPSKNKPRGSRSSSATSLTSTRPRKASNSFLGGASPSHSRSRTPKSSRKTSNEQPPAAYVSGPTPPAFMIRGPDGAPVYAPSEYYPPPDSLRRPSSANTRQVTPPYEAYPGHLYGAPSDLRPTSSPSSRGPHDDPTWVPRSRSASGAPYPDVFGAPLSPAAQARRAAQGGASSDVSYANLRRAPQGSPLSAMEAAELDWAAGVGASRRSSGSSSDDSGEGVRVEVELEGAGGYAIRKVPVGSKSSGAVTRRKGRK